MINGALAHPRILDRARLQMLKDLYFNAQIWRRDGDEDLLVADFTTRIAATTTGDAGRDAQPVIGNAAERFFVALAPRYSGALKNDEVWVGNKRYRVIASDEYPHGLQLLIKEIQ